MDLRGSYAWDLSDPEVQAQLGALADEGLIDVLIGGPPCNTWSRARFRGGAGPRPLRYRGSLCWGLPWLSPGEERRVKEANGLLIFFLSLSESVARQGGAVGLEHPEDPGCEPLPSIWDTDVVQAWEARIGASRWLVDQ